MQALEVDLVFFDLILEGLAGDAQELRGLGAVPSGLAQGIADGFPLYVL